MPSPCDGCASRVASTTLGRGAVAGGSRADAAGWAIAGTRASAAAAHGGGNTRRTSARSETVTWRAQPSAGPMKTSHQARRETGSIRSAMSIDRLAKSRRGIRRLLRTQQAVSVVSTTKLNPCGTLAESWEQTPCKRSRREPAAHDGRPMYWRPGDGRTFTAHWIGSLNPRCFRP